MDEMKKCPKCGGDMEMQCTDTHEHGQTCKMVCKTCGHVEEPTSAPADEGMPQGQ